MLSMVKFFQSLQVAEKEENRKVEKVFNLQKEKK